MISSVLALRLSSLDPHSFNKKKSRVRSGQNRHWGASSGQNTKKYFWGLQRIYICKYNQHFKQRAEMKILYKQYYTYKNMLNYIRINVTFSQCVFEWHIYIETLFYRFNNRSSSDVCLSNPRSGLFNKTVITPRLWMKM